MTKNERVNLTLAVAKLMTFEILMRTTPVPPGALAKYNEAQELIWRALTISGRKRVQVMGDILDDFIDISPDNLNDHPLDTLQK